MRYLRFIIPAAALALVFAYVMPQCGVTVVGGITGFLASAALGAAFAGLFLLARRVELWLVGRYAKDKLQASHVSQLAVLGTIGVAGAVLCGVEWVFPAMITVAGWTGFVLGGFWLSVIGLALTPTPALTASFRGAALPQPAPQPAPAPVQPPVVTPEAPKVEAPKDVVSAPAPAQVVDQTPAPVAPPSDESRASDTNKS